MNTCGVCGKPVDGDPGYTRPSRGLIGGEMPAWLCVKCEQWKPMWYKAIAVPDPTADLLALEAACGRAYLALVNGIGSEKAFNEAFESLRKAGQ